MNSSKIVSCGLSHHVRFPPFNRCRLLIFCLPNKSCMFYMFTTVKFFLKTFVKPKVVFYFVLYLRIQITILHKTFIAFIPITKLPGILVSKEFQIMFAKGITSMPNRKSYFVVGPSALNCPMYLPGPRDFPGCSETTGFVRMTPYQGIPIVESLR